MNQVRQTPRRRGAEEVVGLDSSRQVCRGGIVGINPDLRGSWKFSAPRCLGVSIVFSILALSAFGTTCAADSIPGATVDSLLAVAKAGNPDLAVARLEAEAAAERVQPAGALPDPVLRVELENITNGGTTGVNLAPSRVGDTKYTLMQSLPFPGKRELRRQDADAEAEQARHRTEDTWLDVSSRLKSAFADWWLNSRNTALNRELLGLVDRLGQVAQARYAGGLVPQQDAIRAQLERTALQSERLDLEHERHRLAASINGLLARPASAPLADALELPPLPEASRLASAQLPARLAVANPGLAVEDARIRGAQARRDLAFRERYPDFNLGLVPMQVGSGVGSWGLMLEMNLPLQQESRRSREREAERNLAAAETRKAALTNRLQADLESLVSGFEMARDTERLLADSLLPQAQLNLQSALAGYENGKVDFATLLDSHRQVRLARQGLYRAQAAQRSRLADIERLTGESP